MLTPQQARHELGIICQRTSRPINVNFFCHRPPRTDATREAAWKNRLRPYYSQLEIDPEAPSPAAVRNPFDETFCDLVVEFAPEVVSFHFGLPSTDLLRRVK